MCGICGVVQFDGQPVEEGQLRAMVGHLRHRGPDASGLARPEPQVGLGHTRLKVIDLSEAAAQPMAAEDATLWLVYNGEIFNHMRLREELATLGRRFRSRSDTEVILQAYAQWGEACVERLEGMFAFALLDLRRRQLLLARDRTGKKPLFYYQDARRLVFASEIKGLLAHPCVPLEVRAAALPSYLVYGYVPAPETWYAGVRCVPPATRMVVRWPAATVRHDRYWSLQVPERPASVSRAEAARGVRERLTEAVRRRLASDVPLGAFLSGGIDSTIIVGLMSRLTGGPVHTFSIGFRGDARYDETPFARLAARRFGTRHVEFMVEPRAFELLERLVYQYDQPFGDASAIPTFLLCELARSQVTVALNGDGGDECFAGYRRFQAAAVSARLPQGLSRALAGALARLPADWRARSVRLGELARFLDAAHRPWEERLARWVSYFPDPLVLLRPEWRAGESFEPAAAVRRALAQAPAGSPLAQALVFNFLEYLPNDLNVKMDRCSMAHGLETRSPFLDTAVIEYAFGLPDDFKLRGLRTKAILTQAFADLLPAAIRWRRKQGFGVPLDAWFRAELREPLEDLLLARDARLAAYLDADAVRGQCARHLRGEGNLGLALWSLLTLEVWLRLCERRMWTQPPAGAPGIAEGDVALRAAS